MDRRAPKRVPQGNRLRRIGRASIRADEDLSACHKRILPRDDH
jgi:hypothetical protein